MKSIAMFSWGYKGWGNATERLIQAVDSVEQARGFQPPKFVDIRFHRTVRALGFNGTAFEKLLGERYKWMPELGNKSIGTGKSNQIADPKAAEQLLDRAIEADENKTRLIFFCSCKWLQDQELEEKCHRADVTDLLIAAAKKRKLAVRIVEWPGDERLTRRIELEPEEFQSVRQGRSFVPAPRSIQPKDLEGPAWGSIITFASGDEAIFRLVGPLIWRKERWYFPVLQFWRDPTASLSKYKTLAHDEILNYGLDAQTSN